MLCSGRAEGRQPSALFYANLSYEVVSILSVEQAPLPESCSRSSKKSATLLSLNDRRLERRLPVSGLEWCARCHPERSEGSLRPWSSTLRCAQGDRHSLPMSGLMMCFLTSCLFLTIL